MMRTKTQLGKGDWIDYGPELLPVFEKAAKEWHEALRGVRKPWLCWHTHPRWARLQQRLVLETGWTPVVGSDPRSGAVSVVPGALHIDFNRHFDLPLMWPHFALEWVHLWTDRLAFWHADLICSRAHLRELDTMFGGLRDKEMAAVKSLGGLRNIYKFRQHRYWEVLGCTTRSASEDQYRTGTGWWRNFFKHPNTPEKDRQTRERYYYDSGVGIMYWSRKCNGVVKQIPERYLAGHCTGINNPAFKTIRVNAERDLTQELEQNWSLDEVARKFGVEDLLD